MRIALLSSVRNAALGKACNELPGLLTLFAQDRRVEKDWSWFPEPVEVQVNAP